MLAFQGSIIWSWGSFRFTCVKSRKGFINFCRVSCVMAIKIANRDSSIYDGSQDHSSFWLLQRAACHHYHGLFIGKGHQSFDWKYDHECLHSYEDNSGALVLAKTLPPQFLLEANIAQSRLFDFVQRFSSTIFNYSTSTLSNNLRHLYKRSSHPSCFWISLQENHGMIIPFILSLRFKPWILDSSLERECCTRLYI